MQEGQGQLLPVSGPGLPARSYKVIGSWLPLVLGLEVLLGRLCCKLRPAAAGTGLGGTII